MKINIGVSNRHVHLKKEDLEVLFGEGYELTKARDLTQPGMYASAEKVTIKTEKDQIGNVRVLGPARNYTQVEISKTDAFKLGLKPPIRTSGDLEGSSPITIIGPKGELQLEQGCIIANRHIHISEEDAKKYGFENDQIVSVKVDTEKGGIFDHVHIKISKEAFLELHVDTDDGNGFLISSDTMGEILDHE